jgi:hypothetical protein
MAHPKFRTIAAPVETLSGKVMMLIVLFRWSGWNWEQVTHRYEELK